MSYPSGWDGERTFPSGGCKQDPWATTGMALYTPTLLEDEQILDLVNKPSQDLWKYLDEGLEKWLIADQPVRGAYGISTEFNIGEELQAGDPAALDFMLEQRKQAII